MVVVVVVVLVVVGGGCGGCGNTTVIQKFVNFIDTATVPSSVS